MWVPLREQHIFDSPWCPTRNCQSIKLRNSFYLILTSVSTINWLFWYNFAKVNLHLWIYKKVMFFATNGFGWSASDPVKYSCIEFGPFKKFFSQEKVNASKKHTDHLIHTQSSPSESCPVTSCGLCVCVCVSRTWHWWWWARLRSCPKSHTRRSCLWRTWRSSSWPPLWVPCAFSFGSLIHYLHL